MSFQDAAVVMLVLWVGLTVDVWIIGYRKGRRDLKFYVLTPVFPPAGLLAAIESPPRRPSTWVQVTDVPSDAIASPAALTGGPKDFQDMAIETLDSHELVPVMAPSAGLDEDGEPLPTHAWWLPHRSTMPIEDTRMHESDLCPRCGLHLDPAWPGRCRHCGADFAGLPPMTASKN